MGRRSINTTKSGKFMNPTDQARKEARKRELKKNKRQRMTVRHAVLKSKDPMKILEEIELIDQIEFDPMNPPTLNEKVLKDKRKKLKETFYRVLKLYEKEDPEYSLELRKSDAEQDSRRDKLQIYYEQVKNTERVQIDQIPLPECFLQPSDTGLIPLPDDLPLPSILKGPGKGILKYRSLYGNEDGENLLGPDDIELHDQRGVPAGPPPGSPLALSDSEDEEYDPEKDIEENLGVVDVDVELPLEAGLDIPEPDETHQHDEPKRKQRKIRFIDDGDRDESAPERDTRLTIKSRSTAPISALQIKMLQMAGQAVPQTEVTPPGVPLDEIVPPPPLMAPPQVAGETSRGNESSSEEDSPDEDDDDDDDKSDNSDSEDEKREMEAAGEVTEEKRKGEDDESSDDDDHDGQALVPPGPPPGMPPHMMMPHAPPMPLMGIVTQPLLPGPIRAVGMPPGPPPGLPPGVRGVMPRMPLGLPPHRMMRPHIAQMGIPPPNIPLPPGLGPLRSHPTFLSAPPSIMKPAQVMGDDRLRSTATIEAKPQIKNIVGDVTRFTPTALKVKRQIRDSKGRIRHIGKDEEKVSATPKHVSKAVPQTKTKDHAYEAFMKEMSGLM